jgi:selenocysteine-specific elongation factor
MPQAPASQMNITLGTAGHIDHGKTTLIKLLTGCETDRLKQEKERGMSIELGFAPCRLGDLEVGIVDVPGHENFIKTMVAGAAGIDGVIFVVAADDSIMPQSREHLDILTLLGVRYGMVALTKTDIVSPEQTEKVKAELKQFLYGTFLQDSVICPVSGITGQGFNEFYAALKEMISLIHPRSTDGVFRLPVERTFSVKGFGTVVSGIPATGSAKVGDEVVLLPQRSKSRIKAIQVYGKDSDTVKSGQCAALNLPQIDYKTVERGNVLTQGDYFKPVQWFLCESKLLDEVSSPIRNGTKLKFHTGTSETTGSVYLLESDVLLPGQDSCIQIRTDNPVIAGPNDRFILRSISPPGTLGGGRIIEAVNHKIKRTKTGVVDEIRQLAAVVRQPQEYIAFCICHTEDYAVHSNEVALRTKLQPDCVSENIQSLLDKGEVLELATNLYIHRDTLQEAMALLIGHIDQFHTQQPDSPGIEKDALLEQSGLKKKVFDGVLAILLKDKRVTMRKDRLALPSYSEHFDPATQELLDSLEALFRKYLFTPPKIEDLSARLNQNVQDINKAIRILTEQQLLVRIEQNMYFHADAVEKAKQRAVEYMKGEGDGRLESVKFKYLLDTTRKYAIPMLDYLDKIGVTRRVGNTRYLK